MEGILNPSAAICRKNPGHEQFIPTQHFDPPCLFRRFRSLLGWSLIFHKAKLTVKLIVNVVSPDRPVEFPGENSVRNTGSGYVTDIHWIDPDCVTITIDTAAHVVFDAKEGANTIAKFYFHQKKELFQLKQSRLLAVNPRKDTCRIVYTIDEETLQHLISNNYLSALEYALRPSVLPDVKDRMNISLLHSVVTRYQALSFTWLSFLFDEIKCLKKIKFVSNNTHMLEIEINISLILLYDVILLIIALKSHPDIMDLMEDIVGWEHEHMEAVQRPFIALSTEIHVNDGHIAKSTWNLSVNKFIQIDNKLKCMVNTDFRIQQNETYKLMNCFITSPVEIAELNRALTDFCQFDISARLNKSGRIVFEIPVTSVRIPDMMSLEVNINDVKEEEEDDHIAVLISHPHDMPQQITTGKLERLPSRRIEYTTPSCPGSSGGPVWAIPKETTSLEDIENIAVFTHSHVSGTSERGVGHRFS